MEEKIRLTALGFCAFGICGMVWWLIQNQKMEKEKHAIFMEGQRMFIDKVKIADMEDQFGD